MSREAMRPLTLPAPAKINLFLHILGCREDGYHELQTAFQFLDYSDKLSFTLRTENKISLYPPLPDIAEDSNLILLAAKALQQVSQCRLGADISIKKQLPIGGGIGGGSSNAATTLVALNKIWNINLSISELSEIGLKLGADIPIFIHGNAAWAEGIGERFQPICPPEFWCLVAMPTCHVCTGEIFSNEELTRGTQAIKIPPLFRGLNPGETESGETELDERGESRILLGNDCEALVRKLYTPVAEALDIMAQFGNARMTGTGACVFSTFDTEAQARAAQVQCSANLACFVAKGCNKSPLYQVLDDQVLDC